MLTSAALVCSVLMFADASATSGPPGGRDAEYQASAAKAGKDADAHVRLAIWCEQHGMPAERQKHLVIATLISPENATARGLLGQIKDGESWRNSESVPQRVEADATLAATLAEYNSKRDATPETPAAQESLARWCKEHGLNAEAKAHFSTVVRLDPHRESAWKALGYRKFGRRWMTPEQFENARRDREAQRKADRHWLPILTRLKKELDEPSKRESAIAELAQIHDPRAVPSLCRVFAILHAPAQRTLVQVLGQIDSAPSSRALAVLAASGLDSEVRRGACETLRHRDPREFVGFLINALTEPTPFEVGLISDGEALYQTLTTEEPNQYVLNIYPDPLWRYNNPALTSPLPAPSTYLPGVLTTGWSNDGLSAGAVQFYQARAELGRQAILDRQVRLARPTVERVMRDTETLERQNASIEERNKGIFQALHQTTGADVADKAEAWNAWYFDQLGYRYEAPKKQPKPLVVGFLADNATVSPSSYECFAAGTPVRTLRGPQPIEKLQVGDRVLSQDITSGELSYRPVLRVYQNPPSETLKIDFAGDTIVSSPLHRFWKVDQGWVLARELKAGDVLRTLDGLSTIQAITSEKVQPVYNLDVDGPQTFFAGSRAALVHDSRLPELRTEVVSRAKVER